MVFKFIDLFETKYLYLTFRKDVDYLLGKCVALKQNSNLESNPFNAECAKLYDAVRSAAKIEFDLAGVSMTSDITSLITKYIAQGLVFKDSSNAYRNIILDEDARRVHIDKSQYVALPEFNNSMQAVDWIQSLRKDVVYLPDANNQEIYVPLVIMTIMLRPSVQFCLDNIQGNFFKFIADRLNVQELEKYSEFYVYVKGEGTQIMQFNPKGYIQSLGLVSIEEATTAAYLIPTVVGRERLNKDPIFSRIFAACNHIIQNYRMTRKVTLSEIFAT